MAEERYRIREVVAVNRSPPAGHEVETSKSPAIGRRYVLAAAAGMLALVGVSTFFLNSSTPLPHPAGQLVRPEYLAATLKKQAAPTKSMPPDHTSWSSCVEQASAKGLTDLDLVLAIDTTGSMGGVINDVKANIRQLVAALRAGGGIVRVGAVAYRDTADAYIVRPFPLTTLNDAGVAALNAFISSLSADGGGDWPEKLDAALDVATSMAWRGDVPASVVVIADAPAHASDEAAALATAAAFQSKIPGAQVSLIDSGSGGDTFMHTLPQRGGGQYVTYDGHLLKSLFPAITGCPN